MNIKLRAWDDVAKKMYYGKVEQFDDMLGFRFAHFETENPIYMLSTGRADKKGVDIYRHDIVRATVRGNNFVTKIGVVTWSNYLKCLVVLLECEDIDDSEPVGYFYEIEKVGNLYENPEFLPDELRRYYQERRDNAKESH